MSDPFHLEKVRAGAVVWNKWRRDNPSIVPDLNGLRISASELQFGVVQGGPVDFNRTELSQAVLVHATLIEANLAGAMLTKADLSYCRLNKADLRGADLRGAKLAHADLTDARFDGAFVCGADLRHARGLTQQQIERALGGDHTLLPAGLQSPATWLAEEERERQRGQAQDIDALIKAYDLLGVKPKASMQQIRTAWLRLVKELHPDIAADDPSASERLKAINRAYQGLKSLEQREMARRSQRRTSSGAATFAVFLFLPIAATAAMAIWTHGLPIELLRGEFVAAVTEPRANSETKTEDVALAPASGQSKDAGDIHAALGVGYQTDQLERSLEVGTPANAAAERPDNASDDDAAWTIASTGATPASLRRYIGRYPQGRHVQKAMDGLTQIAAVEVALGMHDGERDAADPQQDAPALRRYLLEYPTGQLADEARDKLAALEADARAKVASWSDMEQKSDAAAKADDKKVPEPVARELTDTSTHRTLASVETAGRESAEDAIAWSDGRHVDAEETGAKDSGPASLQSRRSGHKTGTARAMVADSGQVAKPVIGQGPRTARPSASVAATRWPSADEPFVAADGRIR